MERMYLGDSVYVEADDFRVVLTTNNGYDDDPRNRIILGPVELKAFNQYIERLKEAHQKDEER